MKINKYNDFKNVSGSSIIELTSKEISKIENDQRLVQDFELFAFAKVLGVPADTLNKKIDLK